MNRIHNMALVHDRLQLFSSSVTAIDADAHFRDFCDMMRSLLPPGVSLASECRGSIAGDCIEPLTLIANELVTNAAKHAFKVKSSGSIKVSYQQQGAGWRMRILDNGSGMPTVAAPSFGSQLIETLAVRLQAQVIYRSNEGTVVDVVCGAD